MASTLSPYLSFGDNAREAMDFYQSVFGGEVTRSTFAEFQVSDDPAEADKIMHSQLISDAIVLMAADTPNRMERAHGSSVSLALSGEDGEQLTGYWNGLSEGATIVEPLSQAPWGDSFGTLVDRFGFTWMVNILTAKG